MGEMNMILTVLEVTLICARHYAGRYRRVVRRHAAPAGYVGRRRMVAA